MQAIKSTGSKGEILLAKALREKKIYYRKNDATVFGKPDLTIKKLKIAIFVDSEFFHGFEWEKSKQKIKSNQSFWWTKIEGNIKRDRKVNEELLRSGWTVLRFWIREIKSDINSCIIKIQNTMRIISNDERDKIKLQIN